MTAKKALVALCIFGIVMVFTPSTMFTQTFNEINWNIKGCHHLRISDFPPIPVLIIDIDMLTNKKNSLCLRLDTKIKVGIPSHLFGNITKADYPFLQIVFYEDNPLLDYWKFYDDETRLIPRFDTKPGTNFREPQDIPRFIEYWKRSKRVDCLNILVQRNPSKRVLPLKESIKSLSKLRQLLVQYNMYPHLEAGTLLGWYRECTLIPHTHDIDIAVPIEQFNPDFEKFIRNNNKTFSLRRKLGVLKDSMEYTVRTANESKPNIDIFFMYSNGNETWIGGTGGGGEKYRFMLPEYESYCAADLHGHIFWVSCKPEEVLKYHYGEEWYKDHPTGRFAWNSSPKNVKRVGTLTKEQKAAQYFA